MMIDSNSQAYLTFSNIHITTVPSNNHASPFGALPFLSPSDTDRPSSPVAASKIPKWVTTQTGRDSAQTLEEQAHNSLLDHSIRNMWLYTLYLDEANFVSVARPWYVETATANAAVRLALALRLKEAASKELLKSMTVICEDHLLEQATSAFKALSTFLGDDRTFSRDKRPGLLDAAVFAYTHLLLRDDIAWRNRNMIEVLKTYQNLVQHRNGLMERYFSS